MSYIVVSDITNALFSRIQDADIKQAYIDKANGEAESFAQAKGIIDPSNIQTSPLNSTFKEYLINYALYMFAGDYIGINDVEVTDGDVYKQLFERSLFLINRYKPEITYEMITGTVGDASGRAVSFGRLVRR